MENIKTRSEIAADLFIKGYNCSQSVVGAFADKTGLDFETLMKLSSSFGAGMGKLREVCGAVSGMFIVLGLIDGYSSPEDDKSKAAHYKNIQSLGDKFKDEYGTIICRELLKGIKVQGGSKPEARTEEYYKVRPCVRFVIKATEILDDFLKENNL